MSFVLIEIDRHRARTAMLAPAVRGTLTYVAPSAEKPVSYAYPPPPGVPQRGGRPERHQVAIHDARHLPSPPTLDREGFALREAPTAVRDFANDAVIRGAYYAEVERLLRAETGASAVVIFDHTLRSDSDQQRKELGAREPVRFVHNDYTALSGRRRVSDHLEPEEAARRLQGRHAVVNVWRPIGSAVQQAPLALCDARSIAPDDLIPTDLVYPDRVGEVYSVRYSPGHRWHYFSAVRPEEVLLIKTYDSLEDGTARFSAHTAFDDPTASGDAAPRASIEVRALLFFADQTRRPTWRADVFVVRSAPPQTRLHS